VPALAVSFSFTEEIARYLLVWCTLLGAAAAVRQGGHIGMQLFSPRLQANWARRLSLGGLAVMAGVFGLVAWTGIGYVAQGVRTGETSQGMGLPIAVLRLAIPVGGALVAGRCVEAAARLWRQRKP
jgi:TRAP-type C4-dicarboxylate transport system permease small subunit